MTCCFFSSLKTLLMGTEDNVLTSQVNVLDSALQLAGFQVTLTGRFWVTPEGIAAAQTSSPPFVPPPPPRSTVASSAAEAYRHTATIELKTGERIEGAFK